MTDGLQASTYRTILYFTGFLMISLDIYSAFKLLDLLSFLYEVVLLLLRILFGFTLSEEFILSNLGYF
jgi:hypothetical protein